MARKPRPPAGPQPGDVISPRAPTGWMHSGDDGDQIRAGQAAAMARRHRALPSEPQFVPSPPQPQPPTGWMPHPADDDLVARMHADRQNTFDAAWQGQPQEMPLTLRALSDVPAGNIVNVPP